ncbi:MAG TPA: type III-A CRISPR-associated RAMP protein Csm5 [Ruminococcus flavefaciens]|nr:type III-A CRISPR-associated RAMP protein Csm5 [Ruminococcus flavefaciens]
MKKYYTLTVKTLAPVHIASGKKINKLEYVYSKDSKTVYVMDMIKFSGFLVKRKLTDVFINRIQSGDKTFSLASFLNEKAITENEYKQFAAYSYKNDNVSVSPNQMEIQEFVKDAYGFPYIPGSSIKGALRTAIAYDEIMAHHEKYLQISRNIASNFNNNKRLNTDLETKIFHTLKRKKKKENGKEIVLQKDILNDCMAGFLISDSRPVPKESLILGEKTDLQINGDTHTINILRECIRPETEIVFDVAIDDELCKFSAENISDSLKYFYEDYNNVFRSIFIDEARDTVYEPEKASYSEYIYLGGGTGFPLKSVMYSLFEDSEEAAEIISKMLDKSFSSADHKRFTIKEGISPKVLKCTRYQDKLYEMGRCEISFKEKKL